LPQNPVQPSGLRLLGCQTLGSQSGTGAEGRHRSYGGFESGSFTPGWVIDGTDNTPIVTTANPHSGTCSALLGNFNPDPEPTGDSSFYQQLTVPASGGTLSFWHWDYTTDSIFFDWQDAYITDSSGNILTTIFHQASNAQPWMNTTVDMAPYAGQTVRIKFLVHQDGFGDGTAIYVDDLSTGGNTTRSRAASLPSTTPTASGTSGLPMSVPSAGIQPIYLRVAPPDIALVKFLFESYEGIGIVRTVDAKAAVIVVLVVRDFLPVAQEILRDLQARIDCVEIPAPPFEPDDWLMREVGST
jgi:hypothetical protein